MNIRSKLQVEGREADFVYAIAYGLPPTRAATLAGYAIGSASRLLRKPKIIGAILALQANCQAAIARYVSRNKLDEETVDG